MKIKNIQLVMAEKALEDLIALKLPLKGMTNYKLAEISCAIKEFTVILQNAKSQLISKYELTNANPVALEKNPNYKLFVNDWFEIGNVEVDVPVEPVTTSDLDLEKVSIPIEILRALKPFIIK